MVNLPDAQLRFKQLLATDGIAAAIEALKEFLPPQGPKYADLLLIEARQNDANRQRLRNVLSDEQLQITYNKIREDLLELIEGIEPEDLDPGRPGSKFAEGRKARQGSILYRIPHTMQRDREARCVVRIAADEETIIRNIDLDEQVRLEQIRISDVMQVELIDPSEDRPFAIRTVSTPEQFVDADAYTEWLFYVKPLREGKFPLLLKVAVIELVLGRERKREIVLEETIQILTTPVAEGEEEAFRPAGYALSFSGPQLGGSGLEAATAARPAPYLPPVVEPAPFPSASRAEPRPMPRARRLSWTRQAAMIAGILTVTAATWLVISNRSGEGGEVWKDMGPSPSTEMGDTLETAEPPSFSDRLTDPAGRVYRTVGLYNLMWMAENLAMETEDSWCYDRDPANCRTYGRLYTWAAAQEACARLGWRLPTAEEWRALEEADIDQLALTAPGYRASGGEFSGLAASGAYWTAEESGAGEAVYFILTADGKTVSDRSPTVSAFSCRCVHEGPAE